MPKKTTQRERVLNSYQDSNGLLIQFILFEMARAFEQEEKIRTLLSKVSQKKNKDRAKNNHSNWSEIAAAVVCLAGSSQKNMRIFTWSLHDGILAKIWVYSSYFANNLDADEPGIASLLQHAERAWKNSMDSLDQLREIQNLPMRARRDYSSLLASLEKMSSRLQKLSRTVANFLHQFGDDENVIFYLISNRSQLDAIYQDEFVIKLLNKIFSQGIYEVESFLKHRYTSRGFEHLVPLITRKIEEFEITTT